MIKLFKKIFFRTKRLFSSLRLRFVVIFTVAMGIGVGAYALSHFASYNYIDHVYTSEENRKDREIGYIRDLQEFVVNNGISSENTSKLSDWATENKYVYLLIYKNDELFYTSDDKPNSSDEDEDGESAPSEEEGEESTDSGKDESESVEGNENGDGENNTGGVTIDYPTRDELFEYARQNDLYPLELSDGTVFASLAEFTEYVYYDVSNIVSLAIAFFAVLIICALYFYLVINRVIRLGKEVIKVADGDINHPVRFDGEDEISKLSVSVDTMRNSMMENFRKEREAIDSNTALITSMSHDIRTPLTVLLGYIDVMNMKCEGDPEMQSYLKAAENTAMRLKKLSDDMFAYFLVFGSKELQVNMDTYNAGTLIDQMLSEHILLMRESGYEVDIKNSDLEKLSAHKIYTDAPKLVRILDNIFQNVYKYADKSEPVSIRIEVGEKEILLAFSNKVHEKNVKTESNGIGLKTCKKLCEYINASFFVANEDGSFLVCIGLKKSDL